MLEGCLSLSLPCSSCCVSLQPVPHCPKFSNPPTILSKSRSASKYLFHCKMAITVYMSTITSSSEVKKQQAWIEQVLGSKKIEYETVDVASSRDALDKMREITNDPKALVPQICNGDVYCGDYAAFELAVEDGELNTFLKLE